MVSSPGPVRHVLAIATSGRFTRDTTGQRLDVEMWPDSKLESLLAQHLSITAAYDLC